MFGWATGLLKHSVLAQTGEPSAFTKWVGRAFGHEDISSIESWRVSFGSQWASAGPAWVLFGILALTGIAFAFYLRGQKHGSFKRRFFLAGVRSTLLCLLLLILADPILQLQIVDHPRPVLCVVFDGTDSMNLQDKLSPADQQRWADATQLVEYRKQVAAGNTNGDPSTEAASRMDYVRALVAQKDENLFGELAKKYRLRGFVLDRADGLRAVSLTDDDGEFDEELLLPELSATGEVTALGTAIGDLRLRLGTGNLAGVLMFSDFNRNTGPLPETPAEKLGVPVFTAGVGARTAVDLLVEHLDIPVKMKKSEQSSISVSVSHHELDGERVDVRLVATDLDDEAAEPILVGIESVTLGQTSATVDFQFTPEETGRFLFSATAGVRGGDDADGLPAIEPLSQELVDQNNTAAREVTVIDDFMRLLYVAYEPTWEWRFVKEVFHRDELVGLRGFRTFLRSSDPIVRENNELFLPNLTLPRSEFFEQDVIFLGDMPADALSTRFCEMVKEFVSEFGGGLVVIAGPRFGPGQLAQTPLADILPVFVDADSQPRDDREFPLQRTPFALDPQFDFMQLGTTTAETDKAWDNLGRLQWYQPVRAVEPSATTVLAEHPFDVCADGKTKQPLIAVRQYGRGEVVYVGFNEMWRLRRLYGEQYYRNFWGPLIKRLGLSHALGQQKRFVVRTDRKQYQANDQALLTVEAYDENFSPLTEDAVAENTGIKTLEYELVRPGRSDTETVTQTATVALSRPGLFEARVPVFAAGEYSLRVKDPVTKAWSDATPFQVTNRSVERRDATRNVSVQERLADVTKGRSYELDTLRNLLTDFDPPRLTERSLEVQPLWSTWPCFVLLMVLMLGEWWFRKLSHLP